MSLKVPERLAANCRKSPETMAWLERLPGALAELERRWVVKVGPPYDGPEVSASWVAPVLRADGTSAVLKVGLPHMEAEHEIDGLRFWDGDPTVRVFEADDALGAMLLERCEPGTALRSLPEPEQDVVIAGLLRRLWRVPSAPHPFRPLSAMIGSWIEETMSNEPRGLIRDSSGTGSVSSTPCCATRRTTTCSSRQISMQGTCCARSASRGSSSTSCRSSAIPPTTRRNIF